MAKIVLLCLVAAFLLPITSVSTCKTRGQVTRNPRRFPRGLGGCARLTQTEGGDRRQNVFVIGLGGSLTWF